MWGYIVCAYFLVKLTNAEQKLLDDSPKIFDIIFLHSSASIPDCTDPDFVLMPAFWITSEDMVSNLIVSSLMCLQEERLQVFVYLLDVFVSISKVSYCDKENMNATIKLLTNNMENNFLPIHKDAFDVQNFCWCFSNITRPGD